MIALGVTGTDTGVGKTTVACAMAAALRHRCRVGVLKPVETGVAADSDDRDAVRLIRATGRDLDVSRVCPYVLALPVTPLVAARGTGIEIDVARLDRAFLEACQDCDVTIVESAGGLLSPVADGVSFETLSQRWKLTLVVVAPNRIGVLNHVLLTMRAIHDAGLSAHAVVLNDVDAIGDASSDSNQGVLAELLSDIPVVRFPFVPHRDDYGALAQAAERAGALAPARIFMPN